MIGKRYYLLTYNGTQLGFSGEGEGSEYDFDQSCPICGTNAKLQGRLIVRGIKTKKDFFATLDGDLLISEKLFNDLVKSGVDIDSAQRVVDKKRSKLSFYHLNPKLNFPKASSKSSGLIVDEQCQTCCRNGYFNDVVIGDLKNVETYVKPVKLIYDDVEDTLLNKSDIFNIWEHIGKSNLTPHGNNVIRYARPMLIVSELLKEKFETLKVKNAKFEEVFVNK
jgi:hypothetical protein